MPYVAGRPEDKREAVLQAARDLIARNGFYAAPMSQVAKEANVAAGTIYHYFDSKEELIDELYRIHRDKVAAELSRLDDPTLAFAERFRQVFLGLYAYYIEHPAEYQFIEQYANSPFYLRLGREETFAFLMPLWRIIRSGIHHKYLRSGSAHLLTWLVYGNIVSLVKLRAAGYADEDPAATAETAFALTWAGVERKPEKAEA